MSEFAANLERSALGRRFGFQERGTALARDTVAGMTTFIVMSYIIFIRVFQGRWRTVHPLMWAAAVAFTIYFALPIMQQEFSWI